MAQRQSLLARSRMQALSTPNTSLVKRAASASFRQRCASALMHPVTLVALAVLLVNDLMFKALWPGAWLPGKLSDLAWMMFAPPVLAYVLSFATLGRLRAQRAAFVTAYVGLPLLYVAFNTFSPVHDVVLHVLGFVGGDGPRSPLDPTDSMVIPFAMAAAIWVWRRPPLDGRSIRTRLALLAATAAALASVASSYDFERGVYQVGRTASGKLGTNTSGGFYKSSDGGFTWTKTYVHPIPLEKLQLMEMREIEPEGILSGGRIRITNNAVLSSGEVVYSFEYLQSGGNRWMQAMDKRDIRNRVIATGPGDFFYDSQSGNLILAMGIQGVAVIAPDGAATQVAVGRYSPTNFSFASKVRTFSSSLVLGGNAVSTGLAVLLAFSFAALSLSNPAAPKCVKWAIAFAAAIAAFLAISVGVYPREFGHPEEANAGWHTVGRLVLVVSGYGLIPFLMVLGGLAVARASRRQALTIAAVTTGTLLLIGTGALVLFETGPFIANFVAVALVGLAAFGLWAYQKRRRHG